MTTTTLPTIILGLSLIGKDYDDYHPQYNLGEPC